AGNIRSPMRCRERGSFRWRVCGRSWRSDLAARRASSGRSSGIRSWRRWKRCCGRRESERGGEGGLAVAAVERAEPPEEGFELPIVVVFGERGFFGAEDFEFALEGVALLALGRCEGALGFGGDEREEAGVLAVGLGGGV